MEDIANLRCCPCKKCSDRRLTCPCEICANNRLASGGDLEAESIAQQIAVILEHTASSLMRLTYAASCAYNSPNPEKRTILLSLATLVRGQNYTEAAEQAVRHSIDLISILQHPMYAKVPPPEPKTTTKAESNSQAGERSIATIPIRATKRPAKHKERYIAQPCTCGAKATRDQENLLLKSNSQPAKKSRFAHQTDCPAAAGSKKVQQKRANR
jgi:hypothetical protein